MNGVTNFPVQLTSFVGRKRELADLERLLSSAHLVTLTGPGGCGKTRLALQSAETVSKRFPDGAWFVDLAPLDEPALVAQQVAQVLGLRPSPDTPIAEVLPGFLRSKRLLLILDNCEHLLEASAQLAQRLLSQAPGLRMLATSRAALGVSGESIYPLSGLTSPAANDETQANLDVLIRYDAVRLFVERAQASVPAFGLSAANSGSVVEICRRLDGLPLALELASARVRMLTVNEINERLVNRLALLNSSQHSGREPRHQSLRAAIDWSYSLLSAEQQALFARLGVFSGGCTLDLAEEVCAGAGIDKACIFDLLARLAEQSLIVADTSGRAQARYFLLETIHAYALEKLDEAGETTRLRDRHLETYAARAEAVAPKLQDAYQQLWLNWLEGEHDNLRAALAWAADSHPPESGRIEAGLRIANALIRFWEIRGYVQEGQTWFERLIARADASISPIVHASGLTFASFLAMFQGQAALAMAYGRKAVALAEAAGDEGNPVLILALSGLSSGARAAGDFKTAFAIGQRGIQLLRDSSGPPFYLGMALLSQGSVAIELGDYVTARAALDESLAIARQAGDAFRIAHALNALGDLARSENKYPEAQGAYEQSVALLREINAQHDLASVLHNLGHTALHLNDIQRAQVLIRESLAIHQAMYNQPGIAECLIGFAAIALLRGYPEAGARLLGASTVIGGQRFAVASMWHATQMEYEHYLQLAQTQLSPEEFQAEHAAGLAMSQEQAVQYALEQALKPDLSVVSEEVVDGLTRREREVAALVGQGKTNGAIADELVLSTRTVETHVSHILSKLGFSSRAQIMRWAIEHKLIGFSIL